MWKNFYLIHIQYLGYRFHGWAKQPAVKTIHQMVDKTFDFIFEHDHYKTLGSSRTDAMVSAEEIAFELFVKEELDCEQLLEELNENFPPDMRALSVAQVDAEFNIIQSPRNKEYVYLFSHGLKAHPFAAPHVYTFKEKLNISLMQEGALLFEGRHNFKRYCTKPSANAQFEREIELSVIQKNEVMQASFFPEETWAFHIRSKGFLRNQVRLMMGQLYQLGKGEINLEELEESLSGKESKYFDYIAPASGLLLNTISFKKSS